MSIRKILGYFLLFISCFLAVNWVVSLTLLGLEIYGLWGGVVNLILLPITFFLKPLLRLFLAGAWDEVVIAGLSAGLLFLSFKILTEKPKKIEKPKELKIDKKSLPTIDAFDLLKALFAVPFSYYLIIFSIGLTTAIGLFLIWLIYYVEASLINRVHFGILILLGLGVIIGILTGLYSMVAGIRKKGIFEVAFELKDKSSPIFALVEEVAAKLNTSMPDHILVSFSPSLHVHQSKSTLLDGTKIGGRTLTFGYPYLRHLSPQEAKALIAHELAHFTGRDTLFSLYVFPTYKSFQVLIANLASLFETTKKGNGGEESNTPWMAIPNLLSLLVISKFYDRFSKLIAKIGRIREARADMVGAICYGTNSFKNGLTLVSRIGPVFSRLSERDYWELVTKHQKTFNNYFEFFDNKYLKDKKVKELMDKTEDKDRITSELDTHFSLKERFEYLPDNNDVAYPKKPILDKKTQQEFEGKLSEMYGVFINTLSDKLSGRTGGSSPSAT